MRARAWIVAAMVLFTAGCRESACGDAYLELDSRCREQECAVECGDHEICDFMVSPDVCYCASGYAGDPCTWIEPAPSEFCTSTAAVVGDPCFQGKMDDGGSPFWGDEGGTVLPEAPGSDPGSDADDGEGELRAVAICNAGSLAQTIQMPPYAVAEPLVAEVVYKAQGVHGLAVGFDDAWTRLPATGPDWETESFCLGEAAYSDNLLGGPVTLRLSASERRADCVASGSQPQGSIRIDSFSIRRPRGGEQCPGPSASINPGANSDKGGWEFDPELAGAIVNGAGRDAGGGAQVTREAGATGRASIRTQVFVPRAATKPSPALVFWWRGNTDRLFDVAIGTYAGLDDAGRRLATLVGQGGGLDAIYCLPPWTHGSVVDLSFSLVDDGNPAEVSLSVDDVGIISEPNCGTATELLDPSFDSATAPIPIPWAGTYLGSNAEQVVMRDDGLAFDQNGGVLELTYSRLGASLAMETYVRVPTAGADNSPAVLFYTNAPAQPSTALEWILGRSEVLRCNLPSAPGWQRNEVCLPREWAGRWFRVQVKVSPLTELDEPVERERVLVDELDLVTSSSCVSTCQ